MPNWDSFAAFGRELAGLEGELTGPEKRKVTRLMGVGAQKIADRYATRDLHGDRAFSGWRRGQPIPLTTKLRSVGDGNTLLTPGSTAGQWTTADRGRNSEGGVGLFQGPAANLKTGALLLTKDGAIRTTRRRTRKARRNNGRTQPMHTATDAVQEMERELPKIASKAVLVVTRKRFTVT